MGYYTSYNLSMIEGDEELINEFRNFSGKINKVLK